MPGRIAAVLIGVAIVVAYAVVWPYVGTNVGAFLLPWYYTIIVDGSIGAFAEPFSNYTPPYLYLMSVSTLLDGLLDPISIIKLLSVAGIAFLSFTVLRLLEELGARLTELGAIAVMLLPSVVINGPMLAQCDAIWTAFIVLALTAAIQQRGLAMLIWCGVAFAFKAQAVFAAPFFVGMALRLRLPVHLWTVPALVYAGMMLPAWLVGWPAFDLATVYLRQVEWNPAFIGNAANPWVFGRAFASAETLNHFWLGYLAAAVASGAIILLVWRSDLSRERMITAALLSTMAVPFLLPKMHERFFFAADIIAFALAWAWPRRIGVAILVQASSTLACIGYLTRSLAPTMLGAVLMAVAIAVCLSVFRSRNAPRLQAA